MKIKKLLSVWKISSEDGVELGQTTAVLPKTAFMLWHKVPPKMLEAVKVTLQRDGTYRVVYDRKVFVLRPEKFEP